MELTAPPPAKTGKKNDDEKKMMQAKVKIKLIGICFTHINAV